MSIKPRASSAVSSGTYRMPAASDWPMDWSCLVLPVRSRIEFIGWKSHQSMRGLRAVIIRGLEQHGCFGNFGQRGEFTYGRLQQRVNIERAAEPGGDLADDLFLCSPLTCLFEQADVLKR